MDYILSLIVVWIDALLIAPFRWPADALVGFLLGSFVVSMLCAVVGELTLSAAIRFNGKHLAALNKEIADREALSIQAYEAGDRLGYQALNKEANDAWGRHFFTMAAYSAGMLWPVPFALAWLNSRFHGIEFALSWPHSLVFGQSVGYPYIFIPVYILARIVFGHLRQWLPYFRGVQKRLDHAGT
ncbi:MAG: hypothetical protein VR64_19585 [Desulfatitalea sp. BRH_c12]|nr:MAG: hypothetical protein VR64_19585 [Desulfatitalea sp. BRH_c12]